MRFDDLKDLFKNELIQLTFIDGIGDGLNDSCVDIFMNSVDQSVSLRKKDGADSEYFNAETVNMSNYNSLKHAISKPHFAKVLKADEKGTLLSVVTVPDIDEHPTELSIGIEDGNDNVQDDINDNYIFKICGSEYFIMGKHIRSTGKSSSFIIVNNKKRYYTVELKRKGDVYACNDETSDDRILIVSNKAQILRNTDDYILTVCKNMLKFEKASLVERQTAAAVAFVQKGLDRYIAIWNMLAQKELEYADGIAHRAGSLYYDSIHKENGEYVFNITNPENVENFKKELDRADREGGRIQTEIDVSDGRGTKIRTYIFSWKGFSPSSSKLIAKFESGNEDRIRSTIGALKVSIEGTKRQYERRIGAIERIKKGEAAKPELIRLLNGERISSPKRKYIKPLSQKVIECFKGSYPNSKQERAIEIALNTPDFAIIQGPPGTGKTKVIEAIRIRMSEESEDKKLSFGKVLLTAYQRDATRALGKNRDLYGLPIAIYADDTTAKTTEIDDWIAEKGDKLIERHRKLYEKWSSNRAGAILDRISVNFNKDTLLLENASTVVMDIKNRVEKLPNNEGLTEKLEELQALIKRVSGQRTLELSVKIMIGNIRNLPSSAISYEDDGKNLVDRVGFDIDYLADKLDDGVKKLFGEIKLEYEAEVINFTAVKRLKNRLLRALYPESSLLPSREVNDAIEEFILLAKESIVNYELNDYESIVAKYVEAFSEAPERVRQSLKDYQTVIGATHQKAVGHDIVSIKNSQLGAIEYDNVIIDEAARSCPPDLLIPMSCAKERIILVGDHKQLPQFINRDILKNIMKEEMLDTNPLEETVFEHLIEIAKKLESVDGVCRFVTLDTQYRMPEILGKYTSKCFYEEDGVTIQTPTEAGYADKFKHELPGIENKYAIWMDVPNKSSDSREIGGHGSGYRRPEEARRIAEHLKRMLDSERGKDLTFGIISFYLDQVKEIRSALKETGILDAEYKLAREYKYKLKELTVETVDKMQGLEFDVVYLSMTRSTKDFDRRSENKYGFLDSRNRICVAMTRQKRCLIVCGDKEMLKGEEARDKIPALIEFYDLCKGGGTRVGII